MPVSRKSSGLLCAFRTRPNNKKTPGTLESGLVDKIRPAELAPFGVTVNGIAHAFVKTPMITVQLTEEQRKAIVEKIPVKRFCEPEEVAQAVRFLADPLAGFITGEIIDQNGGLQFD